MLTAISKSVNVYVLYYANVLFGELQGGPCRLSKWQLEFCAVDKHIPDVTFGIILVILCVPVLSFFFFFFLISHLYQSYF